MKRRVGPVGENRFRSEATEHMPCGIEPGKRRKRRFRSAIAIRVPHRGQTDAGDRHIRSINFDIAEIAIEPRCVSRNVTVAEIFRVAVYRQRPDLPPWSQTPPAERVA